MEFLLWIIIFILLIGFGFTPVLWILFAMAVIYFVLVILGKIIVFFCVIFYLIFIEPKRAHPKIRVEEVKEVKRFPKDGFRGWSARVEEVKEVKRFPKEVKEHNEKEVKEYNEKVDKITNLSLILGFLFIVFFSVLITAVG